MSASTQRAASADISMSPSLSRSETLFVDLQPFFFFLIFHPHYCNRRIEGAPDWSPLSG